MFVHIVFPVVVWITYVPGVKNTNTVVLELVMTFQELFDELFHDCFSGDIVAFSDLVGDLSLAFGAAHELVLVSFFR